ncbi:hypothetical protein [Rhodoblastus sp.]|uniref:hypothetical protein n=1 Tax=Rhodoblastus sp. TaxID=1962975 RepID=UPI003F9D7E90
MIVLAAIAFVFGLLSQPRMTLAPFVALNFALIVALILAGLAAAMSAGVIAGDIVVALVAAQAGYFSGLVIEIRRSHPRSSPAVKSTRSAASNIDRVP